VRALDPLQGPQQAAGQEPTMSLCHREQRQLRGIEADLFRSDGIRRRRPRSQHPDQRGAHRASWVRCARVRPPAAQPERTRPLLCRPMGLRV